MACKEVLSQQVDGITVEDQVQTFRNRFEFGESIVNGFDSSDGIPFRGKMMRGNNLLNGIDDKEDIMPFTINLDVCFIPTNRTG